MTHFTENLASPNASGAHCKNSSHCEPRPSQGSAAASFIELERFDIDIPAMMRGLVHELRNPLAAILTASTLLETAIVPPEKANQSNVSFDEESAMLLGVVAKEARRMNAILTEFSHFVKPPTPYIEVFDVAQTVRREVSALRGDAPARWQKIEISDYLPPVLEVRGDPNLISMALRHIVTNAIEAIPKSGQITLSSAQRDSKVALCVDDTGTGLSSEAQERAFQPFFSQKPAATGLGLSLARMLVRASGGELTLEDRAQCSASPECNGAHATISLPSA